MAGLTADRRSPLSLFSTLICGMLVDSGGKKALPVYPVEKRPPFSTPPVEGPSLVPQSLLGVIHIIFAY